MKTTFFCSILAIVALLLNSCSNTPIVEPAETTLRIKNLSEGTIVSVAIDSVKNVYYNGDTIVLAVREEYVPFISDGAVFFGDSLVIKNKNSNKRIHEADYWVKAVILEGGKNQSAPTVVL